MSGKEHSTSNSEADGKVNPSAETTVLPIPPGAPATTPSAETTVLNTLEDIEQNSTSHAETTVLPLPEFDDRGILKKTAWYKHQWVKRSCRIAGWFFGVVFVLLILVQIFIGAVVKSLVTSLGEKYLGVPVSLEKASIQLWRGRFDLGDFSVGNPKDGGYASKRLFHVGQLVVDLDLTSVFCSKFCIEEVLIKDIELNFEGNPKMTSSNLTDIVLHLNEIVAASKDDDRDEPREPKAKMTEIPLEIENFSIENVRVNAVSEGLSVALEQLQMVFSQGQVELGSITISNPAEYGYKTPHFFRLGQFRVEFDMKSLLTDSVRIVRMGARDITVNFEADAQGENYNIRDILRNVKGIVDREAPIYRKMAESKEKTAAAKNVAAEKRPLVPSENAEKKFEPVILDVATIDNFKLNAYGRGVPVTLENITANPSIGRIEVNKLFVHNPVNKGYASVHAFSIGNAVFDVDMNTIRTPKMRVQEIRLKDTDINYESSLTMTSNNISDLLDSVNIFAQLQDKKKKKNAAPKEIVITVNTPVVEPGKASSGKEPGVQVEMKKKELRLQLDLLDIDNVSLHAMPKGSAHGVILPVTLPTMGPLGEDEKGMTPLEIAQHVFGTFYNCISKAVKKAGLKVFLSGSKAVKQGTDVLVEQGANVGNTVVDQGANVGNTVMEQGANVGNQAIEAGKNVTDTILSTGSSFIRVFSPDKDKKQGENEK